MTVAAPFRREPSRARYPDQAGMVDHGGVRTAYEVYGSGEPTIVFVPTWSIVHSRIWKAQIADFARRSRVVTFDPRGNGRSDRPRDVAAYAESAFASDLIAVLDAVGVERAVLVALSIGAQRTLIAAVARPDRVAGLVFIAPAVPLGERLPGRTIDFEGEPASNEGWDLYNQHAWRRDYRRFLEFFFGQCFTEPHSTKPIEDAVGWGAETDPEVLIATRNAPALDEIATRHAAGAIRCPTLVIQGDADAVTGPSRGLGLAAAIPGARLAVIGGGGHIPNVRDPVAVNLLIRGFVSDLAGPE